MRAWRAATRPPHHQRHQEIPAVACQPPAGHCIRSTECIDRGLASSCLLQSPDVHCGSKTTFGLSADDFRSTPINRHSRCSSASSKVPQGDLRARFKMKEDGSGGQLKSLRSFLRISLRSSAYSSTIRRACCVREGLLGFSGPEAGWSCCGFIERSLRPQRWLTASSLWNAALRD